MTLSAADSMGERRSGSPVSRGLIALVLVLAAWCAWFVTGHLLRMLCGIGCVLFSGVAVAFVLGRARRAFIAIGLTVAVLAISPVEVAFAVRRGLPRVVPVVGGLPGPETLERARRDETVTAGCDANGFEPRWVVIL